MQALTARLLPFIHKTYVRRASPCACVLVCVLIQYKAVTSTIGSITNPIPPHNGKELDPLFTPQLIVDRPEAEFHS